MKNRVRYCSSRKKSTNDIYTFEEESGEENEPRWREIPVLPPSPPRQKRQKVHHQNDLFSRAPSPSQMHDSTEPNMEAHKPEALSLDNDLNDARKTKAQHDFLREFQPLRNRMMSALFDREAFSGGHCYACGTKNALIRCRDCVASPSWCESCIAASHTLLPFHRIERWSGTYYQRDFLQKYGVVIHLGHSGSLCPNNTEYANGWTDTYDSHMKDGTGTSPTPQMPDVTNCSVDMTLVHTNGIHTVRVAWCCCHDSTVNPCYLQLLCAGLFPSSISRPQTAFTFELLDTCWLENLECNISMSGIYSKLRRLTDPIFFRDVKDRYPEMARAERFYRDLQTRKRFGFGHVNVPPKAGELGLFCISCAQPGFNLPADWRTRYPEWIPAARIVMDGNFKAHHMKMRAPENDIALTNGEGYMVNEEDYAKHLATAIELKEPKTCVDHKAWIAGKAPRGNLRATGVGACACARHSCFYPSSMVDFHKGERQMNMDFSVANALKRHEGLRNAVVIYDVGCQWCVNFPKRVHLCPSLTIPTGMKITTAVGKWHLSAHKSGCFARFSLNFVRGAGHFDGEAMEPLWSDFNRVFKFARSMSQAHRREVYDDYMRDSNFKKWVGIDRTLARRYNRALAGISVTQAPYTDLNAGLDMKTRQKWLEMEEKAYRERGSALDVYNVATDNLPTMDDYRIQYASANAQRKEPESVSWIAQGIQLEDAQDALRALIRRLPKDATPKAKLVEIARRRSRLYKRVLKYQAQAHKLAIEYGIEDHSEFTMLCPVSDPEGFQLTRHSIDDLFEEPDEDPTDEEHDDAEPEYAEQIALWMPSSLSAELANQVGLAELRNIELNLRRGQANDCLEKLKLSLGQKSSMYILGIREEGATQKELKIHADIHNLNIKVYADVRSYLRARSALVRLNADPELMDKYPLIEPEDLRLSKDVIEENRHGQSMDKLPWFWRTRPRTKPTTDDAQSKAWQEEIDRIHWLRAKARYFRWSEEEHLVRAEMEWTIFGFDNLGSKWEQLSKESKTEGQRAYAEKQRAMWDSLRDHAIKQFSSLVKLGPLPERAQSL